MTERDERDERDELRPKVRVVDKRRYRDGGSAEAEPTPVVETSGGGSPEATVGTASHPPRSAGGPDELMQARAEAAEYRDHLQRLQAEFENYRKRMTRSQERLVDAEVQRLVQGLLEVFDEFDLALIAAGRQPDFEAFRKGVELVYAKLAETLRAEGLERIDAEGKAFDPNEHEALMQTGDGEGDPRVAEIFRQGYKLRGTVIRPASVRVERT
ncbi:MAG TPA: nucleotide exchange factor GrpE [Actinomycetota bacterium]|nr:nucleotide exchange factor GrpE [Actinomycetota bacterium]